MISDVLNREMVFDERERERLEFVYKRGINYRRGRVRLWGHETFWGV